MVSAKTGPNALEVGRAALAEINGANTIKSFGCSKERTETREPNVVGHHKKWQCCNFQAEAHERHDAGVASDCNLEQPSDEMELAENLTDAYPLGLPLPNRLHRFVTLDRAVGSPERAEALARSHPPLDGPMILLQHVIKVLHWPQSTSTPQRAF